MQSEKTNVMRLLEGLKIPYVRHDYADTSAISGLEVAQVLHEEPQRCYKTLVTSGHSGEHYVFVVPVTKELNLKKAAKCVGEKKLEMLPQRSLLPLTGYVHGGCSPIGMKKQFRTVLDRSAAAFATIFFSAGKIGFQVEMSPADLSRVIPYTMGEITDDTMDKTVTQTGGGI